MTAPAPLAPPATQGLAAVLEAVAGAHQLLLGAQGTLAGDAVRDSDEGLLMEVHHALAAARGTVDLLASTTGGEIGRRSRPELGAAGLARKHGFKDPATMLATQSGGSRREATTLIDTGRSMAEAREQEQRELEAAAAGRPAPQPEEPAYLVVARALRAGEISMDVATQITRMLTSVAALVERESLLQVERQLVAKAPGMSADQFRSVVRRHLAWLRAEVAEQRQQRLAHERYLSIVERSDGMVELSAVLDPISAAPVRAVLDGMVKDAFRRRRDQDPLSPDTRSAGQIRADSLVTCAKHLLGCDEAPLKHATTKVVVRIAFEDLARGVGGAEIDGSDALYSAAQLRQMAVDAEYLPVVLGGASEPLDVGRTKRKFQKAQRTALLERDGGCAMCGAPPSHCEAHHIQWWDRDNGASDLANGVMLCVACHHIIHQHGWGIEASASDVWFVPPEAVDPTRTPRLGGRAKFGVTARERAQLTGSGASPGAPPGPEN